MFDNKFNETLYCFKKDVYSTLSTLQGFCFIRSEVPPAFYVATNETDWVAVYSAQLDNTKRLYFLCLEGAYTNRQQQHGRTGLLMVIY
jgi:hypothetical protein